MGVLRAVHRCGQGGARSGEGVASALPAYIADEALAILVWQASRIRPLVRFGSEVSGECNLVNPSHLPAFRKRGQLVLSIA